MVTYSDVISLLVTFFVMMLTFSTANREKFDKARGSLEGAFGIGSNVGRLSVSGFIEERHMHHGRSTATGIDFPPEARRLEWAVMDINNRLKNRRFGLPITMLMLNRGVMIRIPAEALFVPRTAVYAAQGEHYVERLAAAIAGVPNTIEVTNHVSAAGRAAAGDPWQLTYRRSARIAQLLQMQAGIDASRISAGGMGDSCPIGYRPAPEDDRVEIILVRESR